MRASLVFPRVVAPVLLAVMVAAAPSVAAAQVEVIGTVTDSLAGRPLAGAAVQIVSQDAPTAEPRYAISDSSGTFRIGGVAPGRYLLGFLHPRLDDLGLQEPVRPLVVRATESTVRADLAIPGSRTLAALFCGARGDSSGAVVGRVLDADHDAAPVAGSGEVTVSWSELTLRATGGLQRTPRALRASTGADGRFVLCAVPTDVPVLARATAGADSSGEIDLRVPPFGLLQRDLLVARPLPVAAAGAAAATQPGRGTASVRGRVLRPDGAPLPHAQVLLLGSGRVGDTDASGAFALDSLPAGTRQLEARALGYIPGGVAVDLASGRSARADIRLEARVPTLEAVTVYGTAPANRDPTGFQARSHGMLGRFITSDQIARSAAVSVFDLFAAMPGLSVRQTPGNPRGALFSRGDMNLSRACMPDVFLDGAWIADGAESLENLVSPQEIGGIEVYTSIGEVPAEFRKGPCGAVVVWTRSGGR